jgi:hypothetical protein
MVSEPSGRNESPIKGDVKRHFSPPAAGADGFPAIASVANGLWMTQMARNVTDPFDGILKDKRYLIHDRDPLYTTEFLTILQMRPI